MEEGEDGENTSAYKRKWIESWRYVYWVCYKPRNNMCCYLSISSTGIARKSIFYMLCVLVIVINSDTLWAWKEAAAYFFYKGRSLWINPVYSGFQWMLRSSHGGKKRVSRNVLKSILQQELLQVNTFTEIWKSTLLLYIGIAICECTDGEYRCVSCCRSVFFWRCYSSWKSWIFKLSSLQEVELYFHSN